MAIERGDYILFPVSLRSIHPIIWVFAMIGPAIEVFTLLQNSGGFRSYTIGSYGVYADAGISDHAFRFFSYSFVHIGPMHAALNGIVILIFSDVVAIRWNIVILIFIAIAAALSGAAIFVLAAETGILVGGSAIAFGLTGAALSVWRDLSFLHLMAILIVAGAGIATAISTPANVDVWPTHLAGFLVGFMLGRMLSKKTLQGSL